jgi:hypothetical protein
MAISSWDSIKKKLSVRIVKEKGKKLFCTCAAAMLNHLLSCARV